MAAKRSGSGVEAVAGRMRPPHAQVPQRALAGALAVRARASASLPVTLRLLLGLRVHSPATDSSSTSSSRGGSADCGPQRGGGGVGVPGGGGVQAAGRGGCGGRARDGRLPPRARLLSGPDAAGAGPVRARDRRGRARAGSGALPPHPLPARVPPGHRRRLEAHLRANGAAHAPVVVGRVAGGGGGRGERHGRRRAPAGVRADSAPHADSVRVRRRHRPRRRGPGGATGDAHLGPLRDSRDNKRRGQGTSRRAPPRLSALRR
mmetsp:Transcript_38347/g.73476  ORF Transcript_38347/g.73476 Transcript_38347/m.73476 type:complete len:262 (-) Transcript_38347:946-1731(-)